MLMKSMTAGLLSTALMATGALAQTTTMPTTSSAATSSMTTISTLPSSFQGNWRTSKVVGLNVYNDSNESLGSISDLLTDKSGKIVAAVVGVGGFLGVGERYVAIPFEKVKFVTEPVKTSANTGASTAADNSAMPGTRPTPSTTTTGAAVGATAPMATAATVQPNPWYPDHAVISTTKDELKSMAEFKYDTTNK